MADGGRRGAQRNPKDSASTAATPSWAQRNPKDSASTAATPSWTRRKLLKTGGAGAGLGVLGAAGLGSARAPAAQAQAAKNRPNVVLIAVDGLRKDFIGASEDSDSRAKTPNIDALAKDSLRFERAVPESMPALPARRSLISGVRSFPFRDWTATEGFPDFPGWSRIRGWQPSLPGVLEGANIPTVWIADSPLLEESRFENVHRRPPGSAPQVPMAQRFLGPVVPGGAKGDNASSLERVVSDGLGQLDRLRRQQPFFLAIDAFDRVEATDPTPLYVREPQRPVERTGAGELRKTAPATYRPDVAVPDDIDTGAVRDQYAKQVTEADEQIGRVIDKLDSLGILEETAVFLVGTSSMALGEHGVFGSGPAAGHHDAYRTVFMIRDPQGRRKGEESQYFAATHDVATTVLAYLGIRAPGRMEGEDLTALLDEEDPGPRPFWTTAAGDKVICGDGRYVLVSDFEGQEKRIFDSDPDQWEDDHSGDDEYVERDEDRDVSREEGPRVKKMFHEALIAAGGTLPRFGPNAPIRPNREVDDDDNDTDEGALDADDDLNFSGQ